MNLKDINLNDTFIKAIESCKNSTSLFIVFALILTFITYIWKGNVWLFAGVIIFGMLSSLIDQLKIGDVFLMFMTTTNFEKIINKISPEKLPYLQKLMQLRIAEIKNNLNKELELRKPEQVTVSDFIDEQV